MAVTAAGCAELDVGSDVLWTARFETGSLSEWTGVAGGAAEAFPMPPNMIEVSNERAHGGVTAAKLTVTAASGELAPDRAAHARRRPARRRLLQRLVLPARQRQRRHVLGHLQVPHARQPIGSGDRRRALRSGSDEHAERRDDVAPVRSPSRTATCRWPCPIPSSRSAAGSTSRRTTATRPKAWAASTYWLDGRLLVDVTAPALGTAEWVEWSVCSIGENLSPATAVLYIDDCAVSRTRVGPTGIIARD